MSQVLKNKIRRRSDGTQELSKLRLGLRIHAYDDDYGNEAIVSDCLGLLHYPSCPFLDYFSRRS